MADTANRAQRAIDRVRELDPKWEPPQSFLPRDGNIEPRIQHQEMMLRAAETRLAEITRDAVPGTNPSWGVNRLTKELYDQGYRLERPTDAPGFLYRNPTTDEQVRIMERPMREWRYGASIWVRLAAAIRKRCGGRVRGKDRLDSFCRQAIS